MSEFSATVQESPLLEIAKRYKNNQDQSSMLSEALHFHEKNPESLLQIKLLEETDKFINQKFVGEEKYIAQLGILLILRDLLIDPNQENKIYAYLIGNLKLDDQINMVSQKIAPGMVFDLTNPEFLKMNKKAINIGQTVIESTQIKEAFPETFIQNIKNTVFAENDYTNKVLVSLGVMKKQ